MPVSGLTAYVGIFGDFDIDLINKKINAPPSWSRKKGTTRELIIDTPNGNARHEIVNSQSIWVYSTRDRLNTYDLNEHLFFIRDFLCNEGKELQTFANEQCRFSVRITICFRNYGSIVVSRHSLEILKQFNCPVDFSLMDDADYNNNDDNIEMCSEINLSIHALNGEIVRSGSCSLGRDDNSFLESFVNCYLSGNRLNFNDPHFSRVYFKSLFSICGGGGFSLPLSVIRLLSDACESFEITIQGK